MANSAAFCTVAKVDALTAIVPNGSTLKMALYLESATIGAATTAYSASGEASGTNYTAGGATVTHASAASSSGTTAIWTPTASVSWLTVTLSTNFNCALLYDTSRLNAAIASYFFSNQTVTAGNFTLTMPTNDASNALLRIA